MPPSCDKSIRWRTFSLAGFLSSPVSGSLLHILGLMRTGGNIYPLEQGRSPYHPSLTPCFPAVIRQRSLISVVAQGMPGLLSCGTSPGLTWSIPEVPKRALSIWTLGSVKSLSSPLLGQAVLFTSAPLLLGGERSSPVGSSP